MTNYTQALGFDTWIEKVQRTTAPKEIEGLGRAMMLAIADRYPNESSRKKPIAAIRKATIEALEDEDCPRYKSFRGRGNTLYHDPLICNWLYLGQPEMERPRYQEKLKDLGETDPMINATATALDALDSKDQATIRAAMDEKRMDRDEFIRTAAIYYARNILSNRDRHQQDLSDVPTRELMESPEYSRVRGRGEELANRAIDRIKSWNEKCQAEGMKDRQWYIGNRTIAELAGVGLKSATAAIQARKDELDLHHSGCELTPYSNRGVNWAIGDDVSMF
jgi:hypothetical protein